MKQIGMKPRLHVHTQQHGNMLRGSFDVHSFSFFYCTSRCASFQPYTFESRTQPHTPIHPFLLSLEHFSIYDCAWHAGVEQVHCTSENRGSTRVLITKFIGLEIGTDWWWCFERDVHFLRKLKLPGISLRCFRVRSTFLRYNCWLPA